MRVDVPRLPTTTGPLCMPMRILTGGMRLALSARIARAMARAARSARAAWSARLSSAPHSARTARPAQHAPEQERGRDGQDEPEEAGQRSLRQPLELRCYGVLGEVAPDQPGFVGVVRERRVQIDGVLPGDIALVTAAGNQAAFLPAVAPDVEQHRVADLGHPRERARLVQASEFELQRAVREHIAAVIQNGYTE